MTDTPASRVLRALDGESALSIYGTEEPLFPWRDMCSLAAGFLTFQKTLDHAWEVVSIVPEGSTFRVTYRSTFDPNVEWAHTSPVGNVLNVGDRGLFGFLRIGE